MNLFRRQACSKKIDSFKLGHFRPFLDNLIEDLQDSRKKRSNPDAIFALELFDMVAGLDLSVAVQLFPPPTWAHKLFEAVLIV